MKIVQIKTRRKKFDFGETNRYYRYYKPLSNHRIPFIYQHFKAIICSTLVGETPQNYPLFERYYKVLQHQRYYSIFPSHRPVYRHFSPLQYVVPLYPLKSATIIQYTIKGRFMSRQQQLSVKSNSTTSICSHHPLTPRCDLR